MARVTAQGDEGQRSRPSASDFGDSPYSPDSTVLTAAPTALPSVLARAVAFGAIVIAAMCGGLAGYATGALQCSAGCAGATLGGSVIGALVAAGGVAALAALVLRSMSEWADQASVKLRSSQRSSSTGRRTGGAQ